MAFLLLRGLEGITFKVKSTEQLKQKKKSKATERLRNSKGLKSAAEAI